MNRFVRRHRSHAHVVNSVKGAYFDGLSQGYYANIDMDGRMNVTSIRIINWRKQIVKNRESGEPHQVHFSRNAPS